MKNSEILISVIVPIYNDGDTLEKCVLSILKQRHTNLQIILIDDGSTDSTFEVSEQLAHRDKRIEVYHTENGGSVAARKFGLKIAKGQYIGFIDADDYIKPNMFQDLLQALTIADADFVHSGYIEEREGKKETFCNFSQKVFDVNNVESKKKFLKNCIVNNDEEGFVAPSLCTKLFKAQLIKKCFETLDDNQQYGEDFICLLRCVLESRRIMLYSEAMYYYSVNGKSLSHLELDDYMIKEIGMWHYMLKVLGEYQYLEVVRNYMCSFLKRRMIGIISRDNQIGIKIPQYYFIEIEKIIEKKIVLFGAGRVGQDYYVQLSKYRKCNIVAWVDSNWNKYDFEYADVISVDRIKTLTFDLIVIAVRDEQIGKEIKDYLKSIGIENKMILWQEPGRYF